MILKISVIRAVAFLLIVILICTVAGAVKIQTELQYPGPAINPNSSPVSVGTDAFTNSITQNIQGPYKTNSWLSPILWADSKTLIYPDNGAIINGDKHPLYQLPVYPIPWSIFYAKIPDVEADRFNFLNKIDPDDPNSPVLQGLFIRKMPVFSLYDTQQFTPDGSHNPEDTS
ncbi:MAG: hypothetical protein CVV33_03305, partial [Methanomicrobiales archaeon HGW-Methanomicrobiales-4]